MKRQTILTAGIVVSLGGCTMAPEYTRPAAPVPVDWPAGAAYTDSQSATNAPDAGLLAWQDFFPDAKLRSVIATALENNRDLRAAALNVELARAMYGIRRADLFPAIDANGGMSRTRNPADLSGTGRRDTSARYDANLGAAAWEIDFFGRIRSLKDRALQEYLATEQARRSAQILLVSSVADAYLALAADRESLTLAETTLEAQQASYNLIKRRYDIGIVTELDLYRAQTQVDSARSDVAAFKQQTAKDENALNLLAGAPVPAGLLPMRLGDVAPPQNLQAGLPSAVLLTRPDVLQAEDLLKAANADIGAARAMFFPRVSLTAVAGTASDDLSDLFKGGQGAWSFAPRIVAPVFDPRTWSALKASRAQREIAVAQYEKSIQSAFREVADALAVRGTVDRQVAAQESLVHAVSETYRLSASRYDKGIDSYLSVLDAQRSLYGAQQGLVSIRLAKAANLVRLYAVLGGGGDGIPEAPAGQPAQPPQPRAKTEEPGGAAAAPAPPAPMAPLLGNL